MLRCRQEMEAPVAGTSCAAPQGQVVSGEGAALQATPTRVSARLGCSRLSERLPNRVGVQAGCPWTGQVPPMWEVWAAGPQSPGRSGCLPPAAGARSVLSGWAQQGIKGTQSPDLRPARRVTRTSSPALPPTRPTGQGRQSSPGEQST